MYDQLIPGGTLLGYANADHWSVALSLENKNLLISETIRAPQQFPRRFAASPASLCGRSAGIQSGVIVKPFCCPYRLFLMAAWAGIVSAAAARH
jgi:hypothetical protein